MLSSVGASLSELPNATCGVLNPSPLLPMPKPQVPKPCEHQALNLKPKFLPTLNLILKNLTLSPKP